MPKKNNRDNFSPETIRKAAQRVCYQCSICSCLTSAASQESSDDVLSIGVASHICAASPNGPRYNPSQTAEERTSINNCIWLCQTHSKMIDEDVETYSVESLKAIKEAAEKRVNEALTKGLTFSKGVQSGGFTPEKTFEILNSLIIDGDFLNLKLYLESMKDVTMSLELLDIYNFFHIIYQFYCNRTNINSSIENYLANNVKNYVNYLVELFAQFSEKQLLLFVVDYCTDAKLKKICKFILDDQLDNNVFIKEKNNEEKQLEIEKIEKGSFIHKLSTNYAIENRMQIRDKDGLVEFFADEYYYKQKSKINEIYNKGIEFVYVKEQKLEDIEGYKEFELEIPKIKQFVPELQIYFWKKILLLANHINSLKEFNSLYAECCENIRENNEIKSIYLVHQIEEDINNVNFDDVRKMCEQTDNYKLALAYLNELINNDLVKAEKIMNDNQYLFKKDVGFLDVFLRMRSKKQTKNFSFVTYLLKYQEDYKDKYEYNILVAFYSSKNKKYKSQFNKAVRTLKSQEMPSTLDCVYFSYLIKIYSESEDYLKLKEIIGLNPLTGFKIEIANCFQNSKNRDDLLYAKEIYKDILNSNPNLLKVNSYLCSLNRKLKCFNEAKSAIMKELEINFNLTDLKILLDLKIEIKDFAIDSYVLQAKDSIDSDLLMLAGQIYSNNVDTKDIAFNCYLKSLLINDKNINSLKGMLSLVNMEEQQKCPDKAQQGVVARLENDDRKVTVAIHKEDLIQGYTPSKLAGILHYKETDKAVEELLYSSTGDEIYFKNEKFKIVSLSYIESELFAYAMSQMLNSNYAKTFSGPLEESKKQIIEFLEKIKKHSDEIVKIYNESACKLPISILASRLGKKIIDCYGFLFFENTSKIKNINNISIDYSKTNGFILSFDIIYALAILDIDIDKIKGLNCYCSIETKRIFNSELEELIASAKSDSYVGSICVRDGNLYRTEADEKTKKGLLKFCNRVKRILDALNTPDKEFSYHGQKEIENIFYEFNLLLENDTLGFVQNETDKIFVNDDQFLTSIVLLEKNNNTIGLNSFLIKLDLGFEKYLECLKKLSTMNYGNYLTQDVYCYLKSLVLNADESSKDAYLKELYDFFILQHLQENSDDWKHGNFIIRLLIRENNLPSFSQDLVDRIIVKASIHNFSKEFPQEYISIVDNVKKNFRARIIEKDNKMYLDTYLENGTKED